MEEKPLVNYTREAFNLPINLAILSVGVVTTLVFLFGELFFDFPLLDWRIPAFGLAAFESFYLWLMPKSKRLQKAVNSRKAKALDQLQLQFRSARLLKQLCKPSIDRFSVFNQVKNRVNENLQKHQSAKFFVESQMNKLEVMEAYYLELLSEVERYEEHMSSGTQKDLKAQVKKIESDVATTEGRVRQMHQRRLSLLKKRQAKSTDLEEAMQVALIQLDTMDDTVKYLMDQSLSLNNPEEISQMIDHVIHEAEEHHQTAQEMEDLLKGIDTAPYAADDEILSSGQRQQESY